MYLLRLAFAITLLVSFLPAQPRPGGGGAAGVGVGPRPGAGGGQRQGPQQQQRQQQAPKEYRPEELATVEGTVRNGVTGEVLAKASVNLMSMGRQRQSYAATSDAAGKFVITGIEPGQFRLSVRRNGFVSSDQAGRRSISPGSTLTLGTSQAIKNVEAKLIPHGVVTGRVYDSDGEPIVSASVQLMRYQYAPQGQRELSTTSATQTNDLGEYRLFGVPPGKYFLGVAAPGRGLGPFGRAGGSSGTEGPIPTFYPGTAEPSQAGPIEVAMGGTVQGIDVRMMTVRTFDVRGQVAGATLGRRGGSVMLIPSGSAASGNLPPMMRGGLNGSVRPDGEFVVRGVPPGAYSIIVDSFEGEQRMRGTGEVTVGDRHVDNAQVMMHPSFEIPVSVRVDGQATVDFSRVAVSLVPRERVGRMGGGGAGRVGEDGKAVMQQVFPGHYDVVVSGLPAGYFVKSVRAGEAESLADGARIQPGMQLDIVLSAKGATVSGQVANEKGNPVSSASVILMAPNAPLQQRLRTTSVDQQGQFNLVGVAPGDYFLAALEDADAGVYWEPEFLTRNEKMIEKISVREGDSETKPLKVIPASGQ